MLEGAFRLELTHAMLANAAPTQIIIAALNEEEGIAYTLNELQKYFKKSEMIVVDGNSTDQTATVAKVMGAKVIQQKEKGKGDAIKIGLKYIDQNTKYVVLIDADFTYPAEFIPSMIEVMERKPEIGMVCGNRFSSLYPLEAMNRTFYLGNKLISSAHSVLNGIDLEDPLTGLRVIRANLIRQWEPVSKDFDIEVELNNYIAHSNLQTVEIPIRYRERIGEKKLQMKHGRIILGRILSEIFR